MKVCNYCNAWPMQMTIFLRHSKTAPSLYAKAQAVYSIQPCHGAVEPSCVLELVQLAQQDRKNVVIAIDDLKAQAGIYLDSQPKVLVVLEKLLPLGKLLPLVVEPPN